MKFVDEYRDPAAARALVRQITDLAGDDSFKFMEVCGGHTHTIYRHGIEHVLPANVELVHGPGCPVCVIPMGRVDDAIAVAATPGVIFTSFGDMMRVPGSHGNLLEAKARGADVRFVYSPLDALRIAAEHPDRQVVFFAVGFETTAPSTAVTLLKARADGIGNFSVFCNHVTIVPPIKAILESPDLRLDGFLGPGHVSTVVGNHPYRFVPKQYGKPLVTAGFEPLDILQAIAMLLAPDPRRALRGREPVHPDRARRGQSHRARHPGPGVRAPPPFRMAGLGLHLAERPQAAARVRGLGRRAALSRCPASGWPTPRPASAARSSKGSSSHGSARCSVPPARLRRRSAPAWCPRRAPARPTTTSGGCTARWRCPWAGPPERFAVLVGAW